MKKRQQQAEETKKRIYESAVHLMQKHGIENTSIEQISKHANVAVGSFYNYFKSKDDVIVAAFETADHYFETIVVPKLKGLYAREKINTFFLYYAEYNNQQGLDFVKSLYNNSERKLFIEKKRFMHRLLRDILEDGQKGGFIKTDYSSSEIEQFLFISARGIVNDWCLYDGSYDLKQKMKSYINLILDLFIN